MKLYVERANVETENVEWRLMTELRKTIASAVLFNEFVAARVEMSHSEMQSVHLLQLNGPLTPGQLTALTGITSGAMTAVLDRLERRALVRRERHPTDRRKVVVSAQNEQIDALLGPYYIEQADHAANVIAGFAPTQLAVVADFLARLNEPEPSNAPTD